MRASVDRDRCQGHARCWEICPEVFDLDHGGYAQVLFAEIPEELQAKARNAADACPERAIRIE